MNEFSLHECQSAPDVLLRLAGRYTGHSIPWCYQVRRGRLLQICPCTTNPVRKISRLSVVSLLARIKVGVASLMQLMAVWDLLARERPLASRV